MNARFPTRARLDRFRQRICAAAVDPMRGSGSIGAGAGARHTCLCRTAAILLLGTIWLRADQVEMHNGDRYFGKVLSLDTNTVVLKADLLGTVRLARSNVALITIGAQVATNPARGEPGTNRPLSASAVVVTNGMTDLSAALRQLGANTNFIQQVQAQFLGAAGPEANNKFNELVGGLMNGKLTVNDIRAEAKTAADQLKELKRELGDDAGWTLDGYLAVLESFLQQSEPANVATTNTSPALPKTKPAPVQEKR